MRKGKEADSLRTEAQKRAFAGSENGYGYMASPIDVFFEMKDIVPCSMHMFCGVFGKCLRLALSLEHDDPRIAELQKVAH